MPQDRRTFLRNLSLAGAGLFYTHRVGNNFHTPRVPTGRVKITILHTADIHAQLQTHDEFFIEGGRPVYKKRGGFAVLKTMLQTLKAENPENTILIDGGDLFQGSGVAALSKGQALVPLINNLDYDLVLPGNWEVVYGKEMMLKDLDAYSAHKVCANMFYAGKHKLIFPPYWIKKFGSIKIGFIGYNDPYTAKRQSPAYSNGINFTLPEYNLEHYIKLLKEKKKCDLLFVVTHLGLAQQVDLASKSCMKEVDFLLGADTHERIRKPIQTPYCKVTEPGAFGSFVSKLDLFLEDGKLIDSQYQLLDVDPEKYPPDKEMENLVDKAREPYKDVLDKVIGYTQTPLVRYYILENPMDNLITDAIMWKFKPDIALSNGFRFCPPLVPQPETGVAAITNEFLWSMLPVDSEAKSATVTGLQLWNWLEKELNNVFSSQASQRFGGWLVRFSGMEINFTAAATYMNRLNSVKIKGLPLDKNKEYLIVACERDGDPDHTLCREENVRNPRRLGISLHEVMRDYLAVHSPVAPQIESRVTTTDTPKLLLSQVNTYGYEFH